MKFEIDEIAIVNHPEHPEAHGSEVEITTELTKEGGLVDDNGRQNSESAYGILHNGFNGFTPPYRLRKKRPPQKLSGWETVEKTRSGALEVRP